MASVAHGPRIVWSPYHLNLYHDCKSIHATFFTGDGYGRYDMPNGYFIARCTRDQAGRCVLESMRDHVQRPLVWRIREEAERGYTPDLRQNHSLWFTWNGSHAMVYIPGIYDNRGEESAYVVPAEVLNELVWLEYAPRETRDAWSTGNGIASQVDIGSGQKLTVYARNEAAEVFGPNEGARRFESLAEATTFVETCRNSIEGVTSQRIAANLLRHAFSGKGAPPETPAILMVPIAEAAASQILYDDHAIPVWTCSAGPVRRHWLRRTTDPVLDQANSINVYEDAYGAITGMPVSEDHLASKKPSGAKERPFPVIRNSGPVPFRHIDRANTWLASLGLNSRVSHELPEGLAVCEPCPGEGVSVRIIMRQLGYIRENSAAGVIKWCLPMALFRNVLVLEDIEIPEKLRRSASADMSPWNNETYDKPGNIDENRSPIPQILGLKSPVRPKGGVYIDLGTGKDITGETCWGGTFRAGDNVMRLKHGEQEPKLTSSGPVVKTYSIVEGAGWTWIEKPEDSPDEVLTIESGGQVFHAIEVRFESPVTLAALTENGESKLVPTTRGRVVAGDKVGAIYTCAGLSFPVYDHVAVVTA